MNIVVLAGGLSAERDVSICTGEMVCNALKKCGHAAVLVDLFFGYRGSEKSFDVVFANSKDGEIKVEAIKKTAPDLSELKAARDDGSRIGDNVFDICKAADIVFMALHGEDGENGKVQAAFDLMGIKYSGSGYLGSAIAMDKVLSKNIFTDNGILTPCFEIITEQNYEQKLGALTFPLVIKPSSGGSSIGVSIVNSKDGVLDAMKKASVYNDDIIVESYIKGREFSVGVLGDKALPIIEIIPEQGFYDYENKYQGLTLEITPAELDGPTTKKMQDLAVKAHNVLGLEVYSRTDFLLDEAGDIYCLESNTLPGMTPTSLLPQEAAAVGIDYETLCEKIIELSLERFK
jgi:D-alanine-D-alanine ligase